MQGYASCRVLEVFQPNALSMLRPIGKCCAFAATEGVGPCNKNSAAMCVTMNVTLCLAAHGAANLRNEPKGSEVLQSRSRPASVGELSDAKGPVL